jgi:hypothetical protein
MDRLFMGESFYFIYIYGKCTWSTCPWTQIHLSAHLLTRFLLGNTIRDGPTTSKWSGYRGTPCSRVCEKCTHLPRVVWCVGVACGFAVAHASYLIVHTYHASKLTNNAFSILLQTPILNLYSSIFKRNRQHGAQQDNYRYRPRKYVPLPQRKCGVKCRCGGLWGGKREDGGGLLLETRKSFYFSSANSPMVFALWFPFSKLPVPLQSLACPPYGTIRKSRDRRIREKVGS